MKHICIGILILLGILIFVLGEKDDSPGAQLIGLVCVALGIIKLFVQVRRKKEVGT